MNVFLPIQISSSSQLADDGLAKDPDRTIDREENTGSNIEPDPITRAREEMGGSDAKYPANAGLADSQSKSTEPVFGDFLLQSESGDEWFKVTRQDGSLRSGEHMMVDRGDTVEISFNAFHINSRKPFGYVYSAEAEVTHAGELLIRKGDGEVFGAFTASANPIVLLQSKGNMIRFDRAVPQAPSP